MRKTTSVISLTGLIFLFLVGCENNLADFKRGSKGWVRYKNDIDGIYLYKIDNAKKNKGKLIIQVWNKMVYSDAGRKKYIQDRIKDGLSADGYEKLAHRLVLYEINCKNQRTVILSVAYYDSNSKLLCSLNLNEIKWKHIDPYTSWFLIQEGVCK